MDVIKMNYDVVYFAHPLTHYDNDFEWECINTILTMLTPVCEDPTEGKIHIMNPNQKWLRNLYVSRRDNGHDNPFDIFRQIAKQCDTIVGVSFFDGSIGAGVSEEMNTCIKEGIPAYLIFINNGIKLFMPITSLNNFRVLSIVETREKTVIGAL